MGVIWVCPNVSWTPFCTDSEIAACTMPSSGRGSTVMARTTFCFWSLKYISRRSSETFFVGSQVSGHASPSSSSPSHAMSHLRAPLTLRSALMYLTLYHAFFPDLRTRKVYFSATRQGFFLPNGCNHFFMHVCGRERFEWGQQMPMQHQTVAATAQAIPKAVACGVRLRVETGVGTSISLHMRM